MGWSSATELFDGAVDVALRYAPKVTKEAFSNKAHQEVPDIIKRAVIEDMYLGIDWGDWDTQDESKYWDILEEIMVWHGAITPRD